MTNESIEGIRRERTRLVNIVQVLIIDHQHVRDDYMAGNAGAKDLNVARVKLEAAEAALLAHKKVYGVVF